MNFWQFVSWLFTSPLEKIAEADNPGEVLFALLGLVLIWGVAIVVILVAVALIGAAIHGIWWLVVSKPCQHCEAATVDISSGEYDSCHSSQPCCKDHRTRHMADAEPCYNCPADGTEMVKVINHLYQIIDTCPSCHGVFVSSHELSGLLDDAKEDGQTTGFLYGVAVG